MTFTIRRAVASDASGACDAVRRSISELCVQDHHGDGPTLTAWLANKTEANFARWMESDYLIAFVAEKADGVVGFGLLDRRGAIALLYVVPEVRFQGVSKALLAAIEDAARSLDVQTLTLESTGTARLFYERAGYVSAGDPKRSFGMTTGYPMSKQVCAPTGRRRRRPPCLNPN